MRIEIRVIATRGGVCPIRNEKTFSYDDAEFCYSEEAMEYAATCLSYETYSDIKIETISPTTKNRAVFMNGILCRVSGYEVLL